MSDHMEKILFRVRALLAKAASTEFEAERESFLKAADNLMEKYAIEEVMLLQKDDSKAKLITRKDMDISWWSSLKELDHDSRSEIYWLWTACVRFCRCVGGQFSTLDYKAYTVAVYGLPSDLSYLDLLFTDLLNQMIGHIRPKYDPDKSMGENIAVAKASGMKYADIAIWMGRPDWVVGGKPVDHGIMARAYKEFVKEQGQEWITVRPATYLWSYLESFCLTVRTRLYNITHERQVREGKSDGNPMAVALRDVKDQAMDAFYEDFPHLRPHEAGCTCKDCTRKRKPVKYRERKGSELGRDAGHRAGREARIASNDPALRNKRQLGS